MEGAESVAEHKGDLLEHGLIHEAETQEFDGEENSGVSSEAQMGGEEQGGGGGDAGETTKEGVEEAEEGGENVETSKNALVKAIFGDSDEEDNNNDDDGEALAHDNADGEDDDDYVEASTRKLKRLVKRHRNQASDDEEEAPAEEEEAAPEEEEATPKKKKKRLSKKKRNAIENASDEEGDAGEEKKKKKKRKKKAKAQQEEGVEGEGEVVPDDGNDSDGPVRRKKKEFEGDLPEFDAAMARLKPKRARKELTTEEETKLTDNVNQFIIRMEAAAELDQEANQKKQPATNKIAMLKEVSEMLHKTKFGDVFVNQNGFTAIRKWLQPLPDKSLPNLNIREQLLEILFLLPFDKEKLQNSDVGKVVMFLYKDSNETVKNKRQCGKIIEKWSRPLFGLQTAYRKESRAEEEDDDMDRPTQRRRMDEEETEIDKRTREQMKDNRKFHARIPNRIFMDFKNRPVSADLKSTVANAARNPHVAAAEADRILKKKRKAKPGATTPGRVMRAERISIEGRLVK